MAPETADSYLLEVNDLSKAFKGLLAVDGYRVQLRRGEILGIIGPNGAGKTTVFNLLTGYIRPTRGVIRFLGRDITHFPPDRIATLGIGRTFQNIRLFPTMSVLDNVKAAQQLRDRDQLLTTLLTWPSFMARERRLAGRSLEQLALFDLADRCRFAGHRAALRRPAPVGDRAGVGAAAQTAAAGRAGGGHESA